MSRDIRKDLFSFAFIKKSPFFGSCGKLQYRIGKEAGEGEEPDRLTVCIYPGPYSIDYTPEEQKEYRSFAFTPEGYEEAAAWLQEKVDSNA